MIQNCTQIGDVYCDALLDHYSVCHYRSEYVEKNDTIDDLRPYTVLKHLTHENGKVLRFKLPPNPQKSVVAMVVE